MDTAQEVRSGGRAQGGAGRGIDPPQLRRLEDGPLVLGQKPQAQLRAIRTRIHHAHRKLAQAEAEGEPFEGLDREGIGAPVDIEQDHRHPFRREASIAHIITMAAAIPAMLIAV